MLSVMRIECGKWCWMDKSQSAQKWKQKVAAMGVFKLSWRRHMNQMDQMGSDGNQKSTQGVV